MEDLYTNGALVIHRKKGHHKGIGRAIELVYKAPFHYALIGINLFFN